jgi:electron transfer flavoprotein beta subunit
MVAELLSLPHVGNVIHLEVGEGKVTAHREIEGAHEVVECGLPAVLTAQKGLNEPRYASLKGIMGAKKKPIAEKKLSAMGIAEADAAGAKTRWRKLELPPPRKACHMIPADDAVSAAKELVRLLREEAKVI